VGKAGQLLNNMIAAMGLKREEVYIANCQVPPAGTARRSPTRATPAPRSCSGRLTWCARGAGGAGRDGCNLSARPAPAAAVCAAASTPSGMQLIITYHPAICSATRVRKKKPGPICRLPCANWD